MFSSQNSQVSNDAVFVEDVFSNFLYTGNGSTQTITNGIDLAGKGGLTWLKRRDAVGNHNLFDTARGATKKLYSDLTNAEYTDAYSLTSFNANGFSVGVDVNGTDRTYASWTFRKQKKFFDVVTYTGNGAVRTLAHNLGSVPACVLIKCTSLGGTDWMVFHRSVSTGYLYLNDTAALMTAGAATFFGNGTSVVAPDATSIYLGSGDGQINQTSATYVAYLFAHDAGGFGLTGTDNVISCGSYTGNGSGSGPTVTLGYEPQWLLIKRTDSTSNWTLIDNMRGIPTGSDAARLFPNLSNAEITNQETANLLATGFKIATADAPVNASGGTFIYIAIRRGPMKVPTDATKVFAPITGSYSIGDSNTTGFPVSLQIARKLNVNSTFPIDRLRGISSTSSTNATWLKTNATDAENTSSNFNYSFDNTKYLIGSNFTAGAVFWNFQRAPSFFDEVCYTGNGSSLTLNHNLGVAPELIITKSRSNTNSWWTYHVALGNTGYVAVDSTAAAGTGASFWNSTTPSSTTFSVSGSLANAWTYTAYLFATCAGVSKVFSYTGNGSSQTINCGFTGGARWILIKRTDSTGDWYVWDSARGIVSGNDPHLSLNTTAAEVTSDDTIDTDSTGFVVNQVSATNVNVSSATYIGIAIA